MRLTAYRSRQLAQRWNDFYRYCSANILNRWNPSQSSFTHSIGRIIFNAGLVEFLIGCMLPDGPTGQSGKQLIEAARAIDHPAAINVVEGNESLLPDRNHLVHGTYQVFDDHIVAWHLHRGGATLTSHPYSVGTLEFIASSWRNLATAAHTTLHSLSDRNAAHRI